jgi:hypothetical protein
MIQLALRRLPDIRTGIVRRLTHSDHGQPCEILDLCVRRVAKRSTVIPNVHCSTELMCQTRAGESGSWFGIAPNEVKESSTALAIGRVTIELSRCRGIK